MLEQGFTRPTKGGKNCSYLVSIFLTPASPANFEISSGGRRNPASPVVPIFSMENSESLNMEEPLSIHLKTKFFPKISEAKCSIFDNICRKTLNKINDCPNKTIKPTKTTVLISNKIVAYK